MYEFIEQSDLLKKNGRESKFGLETTQVYFVVPKKHKRAIGEKIKQIIKKYALPSKGEKVEIDGDFLECIETSTTLQRVVFMDSEGRLRAYPMSYVQRKLIGKIDSL